MNSAIEMMLNRYVIQNNTDRENAVKEILQEIALAGLSRGGFFDKAAFYGGTCLRIFHGLDRFSEDLDFALLEREPSFQLETFFPSLQKEFTSYGIDLDIEAKHKNTETNVQSAFLKGDTLTLLVSFFPAGEDARKVFSGRKTKIKFEIDTDNPAGGKTEYAYRLLPSPYEIRIFDEPTLFSGKIHALLCREYAHRVKGRDYYDYLFYIGKGTGINLPYLENKLKDSGKLMEETRLDMDLLKRLLTDRFRTVDLASAKEDVLPFVPAGYRLELWKPEFFLSTVNSLHFS